MRISTRRAYIDAFSTYISPNYMVEILRKLSYCSLLMLYNLNFIWRLVLYRKVAEDVKMSDKNQTLTYNTNIRVKIIWYKKK